MLSLNSLANNFTNGLVRGKAVYFTPSGAENHPTRWKRKRRTAMAWVNGHGDNTSIWVRCYHPDQNPIEVKDWIRSKMGLAWKPRAKGPKRDPIPQKVRNQFFAETLNVLRYWKYLGKQITAEQFSLLINDLRPKDETTAMWAGWYASEFGFEGFTYTKHHTYTADQRAEILGVTYADRQWLGLRRTGAIDLDKAGRERARRDRYNAKRRAKRAIETNQRSRRVLDVCKRGVNRQVPSLEAVIVTKVVTESDGKTLCNKPRVLESHKSCPKIASLEGGGTPPFRRPYRTEPPTGGMVRDQGVERRLEKSPPETTPKQRPDSIPFQERVGLMMQHCGLGRVEAEVEARKWLLK